MAKKDPSGNIFYYHLDHLDGINVVTDATGTEITRTDYLPFGDERAGSTSSDNYAYTGKEKDKTGLYYFDARYNSPEFRHFTQADVSEPDYDDPQDLNRYAYVGNNPLSYVDYDGFKKKKHHSKKEEKILAKQRAAANALKKSEKKEKEKARAAADYAKHHPANSLQVGAGHTLAVRYLLVTANPSTNNGAYRVMNAGGNVNNSKYGNSYTEEKDLFVTALSEIPDEFHVVDMAKSGKYFYDDAKYLMGKGSQPSAYEAPFGIGFMVRSTKFFYDDAKYLMGKGPEPSAYEVLKEAPGVDLAIKGTEYFGKKLGERD